MALQNGWKCVPSTGNDNFTDIDYTYSRKHNTAIWVDLSISKDFSECVAKSIKKHMVCASEDEDFDMRTLITLEGVRDRVYPMGDTAVCRRGQKIFFTFQITEFNSEEIGRPYIIIVRKSSIFQYDCHQRGYFISRSDTTSANFVSFFPPDDIICYYFRVDQPDGDTIISAPVWIKFQ